MAAHELVHKHGKAVLGEAGWRHLHEVIGTWANRPEGSLERQVYDEAAARVQGSRPTGADEASYSSEELFPYAVQVAMELGLQPTALMPANSVQGWLARVRASLQTVLGKLTGNPQAFDGQDLVDLAFGIAQRERATAVKRKGKSFKKISRHTKIETVSMPKRPGSQLLARPSRRTLIELHKFGINAKQRRDFLQGEQVIFEDPSTEKSVIYVFKLDRGIFRAGIWDLISDESGAIMNFSNQARSLGQTLGVSHLELFGADIRNTRLARLLAKRGFSEGESVFIRGYGFSKHVPTLRKMERLKNE